MKMIKKCLFCGKEFEVIFARRKQKFCSSKCYHSATKGKEQKNNKVKVICQICGKEFKISPCIIKMGRGKYCSNKCRGISLKGKKRESKKVKVICQMCEKEFEVPPSRKDAKYCSRKCASIALGAINKKKPGEYKKAKMICKECGKEFEVSEYRMNKNVGYCSKECFYKSGWMEKKCEFCGKTFKVMKSHKERRFCSRKCYGEAQKGQNNYFFNGGKKAMKERQKNDLMFQLNARIGGRIRHCLKRGSKNEKHWENLVGYTVKNLQERLQKTMPNGYTWEYFLNGDLHIDHIIPVRLFTFKTPEDEEFRQCWNLYNLRLLPAKDNIIKKDKITNPILLGLLLKETKPLQLALAI